jgi:hypothetical protein
MSAVPKMVKIQSTGDQRERYSLTCLSFKRPYSNACMFALLRVFIGNGPKDRR